MIEKGKSLYKQLPLPPALPLPVPDAHTHLDRQELDNTALIELAKSVNVYPLIQVGCDIESSKESCMIADQYPGDIYPFVGIHPNDIYWLTKNIKDYKMATNRIDQEISLLVELLETYQVAGIGETGLDYYKSPIEAADVQLYSLGKHIELAIKYNKPLMIHNRNANYDALDLLDKKSPNCVIFHCFSDNINFAKRCIDNNYYMSISGTVTFKNNKVLRDIIRDIPLSNLLVETDAPFLTPEPYRGKENRSFFIPFIISTIANIKKIKVDIVCKSISNNMCNILNKKVIN